MNHKQAASELFVIVVLTYEKFITFSPARRNLLCVWTECIRFIISLFGLFAVPEHTEGGLFVGAACFHDCPFQGDGGYHCGNEGHQNQC